MGIRVHIASRMCTRDALSTSDGHWNDMFAWGGLLLSSSLRGRGRENKASHNTDLTLMRVHMHHRVMLVGFPFSMQFPECYADQRRGEGRFL